MVNKFVLSTTAPQVKQNVYPAKIIDGNWGQVVEISLLKTDLVLDYIVQLVEGTLEGGTSPAWTVSASNPAVLHIKVEQDNETLFDMDAQVIQFLNGMFRNLNSNGLMWIVDAADVDARTKQSIVNTGWPTYLFSELKMYVTLPALSAITSGSPTGTSGSQLLVVEEVVPRFAARFNSVMTKKVENSIAPAEIAGDNYFSDVMPKTGLYKYLGLFVSTTAPSNGYPAYTAGSDSAVSKVEIELNSIYSPVKNYWSSLKQVDSSVYHQAPGSGFAIIPFMTDLNVTKMLNLSNPNAIKSAILKITTTTAPVYITEFYTLYR